MYATEHLRLSIREGVHGVLAYDETSSSVVDGEDVDCVAIVAQSPVGTAVLAVPACNCIRATNHGKVWYLTLCLITVFCDQAIATIGARDNVH